MTTQTDDSWMLELIRTVRGVRHVVVLTSCSRYAPTTPQPMSPTSSRPPAPG